jgi:integrating conjugative element membrane protein (TIGR03747 family)
MDKTRWTGLLWWVKWSAIIFALTLVAHLYYTLWPYPQGQARGAAALQRNLDQEWATLVALGDERFPPLAYALHEGLYAALFQAPGFDYMLRRSLDPTPMADGDELMRKFVLGTREFWESAAVGLQLFCARLAVLILTLPLLFLAALGGISDGLVGWFLRRTGGGRESGFIYHRAKRMVAYSLVLTAAAYLVPPVVMDPRWILPPLLIVFASGIRYATAYFKKYV